MKVPSASVKPSRHNKAMRFCVVLFLYSVSVVLLGQTEMNIRQLAEMIRSELAMHHDDRKLGDFLKRVRLSEKLDEKTIQDLAVQGAGPRTLKALELLKTQSANLKEPANKTTHSPLTDSDTTSTVPMGTATGPAKEHSTIPSPDQAHQQDILNRIKQYALSYTKNLPNFVCTQVMRRYVDSAPDQFHLIETDVVAVSYSEGREKYVVKLVNNRLVNMGLEELTTHGGTISSGEFGNLMAKVFEDGSNTTFNWEKWTTLRGRRMSVFNYFIDSGHSNYTIDYNKSQNIVTAYRGLVYADEKTGEVLRITFNAVDIPSSFPVVYAYERLDYDNVEINGKNYICPLSADLRLDDRQHKTKNEIEFRLYKKFGTESTITFDAAGSETDDQSSGQPSTIKPKASTSQK